MGALAISGLKLEHIARSSMSVVRQLRCWLKCPVQAGALPTVAHSLERLLEKLLPANAHELCTDRLGVSLTKAWSMENKFISNFRSRRHLIDTVCAGCFIPIWSGALVCPRVAGERFIDGAYSNNSPKFESLAEADSRLHSSVGSTAATSNALHVEICPFSSEVDVSPKGESYLLKLRVLGTVYLANWSNIRRTFQAMLPLTLDHYVGHLKAGHRDMKDYLLRNNLIKCRLCHARDHKGPMLSVANGNECDKRASCVACLRLCEQVDSLRVSDEIVSAIRD